jgi:hypothetical protein
VKSADARSRLRADEPPTRSTEARPGSGQPDFLLHRMAPASDRIRNGEVEPQVSIRQCQLGLISNSACRLTRTTKCPIYPPRRTRTGNQKTRFDELIDVQRQAFLHQTDASFPSVAPTTRNHFSLSSFFFFFIRPLSGLLHMISLPHGEHMVDRTLYMLGFSTFSPRFALKEFEAAFAPAPPGEPQRRNKRVKSRSCSFSTRNKARLMLRGRHWCQLIETRGLLRRVRSSPTSPC